MFVTYFMKKLSYENSKLKYNFKLNSCFLRKALVSDRVITDACLLVFVLWRDSSRVFMRMRILLFLRKAD